MGDGFDLVAHRSEVVAGRFQSLADADGLVVAAVGGELVAPAEEQLRGVPEVVADEPIDDRRPLVLLR
nr:hypothetical protein [Haloferax sp. ATB1]